jgi:ATP-dependent 26S proteasome regulatory subunit
LKKNTHGRQSAWIVRNIQVCQCGRINGRANGRHADNSGSSEVPIEDRAANYKSEQPYFGFDFLVVPNQVREDILSAADLIRVEAKVFDDWGLRAIEPFPRTALNFHGPPGTGKTLAAHVLASTTSRCILSTSYAQIESMYHGEGPKNLQAIFYAAERDNALLFVDEADSLLSKKLVNVTQGSEQAINSMRSELLICLERFRGVVVFSTNFVDNYDRAFESRLKHVYFPLPDEGCRLEIWRKHLPGSLPLAQDVCLETLAKIDDLCGRDIKNAVIDAAVLTARIDRTEINLKDLTKACERIKARRIESSQTQDTELDEEERVEAEKKVGLLLKSEREKFDDL